LYSIASILFIVVWREGALFMSSNASCKIPFCHDTGNSFPMCKFASKVPAVFITGYRGFLKVCACPVKYCKYQNELSHVPFVPVYWVKDENAPEEIQGDAVNKTQQPQQEIKLSSDHSIELISQHYQDERYRECGKV
jgi:hypothetical protein